MKIHILKSNTSDFKALSADIGQLIATEIYDDTDALILAEHDCDGILLDLDSNRKKMDGIIKSIRKTEQETPILVLCNSLEGKNIQKHQKSRSGADIYFTYPMDPEVIRMTIEESFNSSSPDDTRTVVLGVLKEHDEKSISTKAQNSSEKLDSVFSSSFFGDYSDRKAEEMEKKKKQEDAEKEQPLDEIGLDEELNLDDDLSIDMGEAESSEDNGLSLSDDDGLSLDLGESETLDLGEPDEEATGDPAGDDKELDLSMESLSLGDEEVNTSVAPEEPEEEEEGLDLGGIDLPGFNEEDDSELDLGDDSPEVDDESLDLGVESIELSSDDDSDEGLDFNIEGDEDEGGVSINEEDATSASQMFDLGKDDTSAGIDLSNDGDTGSFNLDEEINLSEMDESINLSEEDENLKETGDLDEFDVTRPILQEELDQIKSSELPDTDGSFDTTIQGLKFDELKNTNSHENIDDILGAISAEAEQPIDDLETKIRQIDDLLKMDEESKVDINFSTNDVEISEDPDAESELSIDEDFSTPEIQDSPSIVEAKVKQSSVRSATTEEHKEYIENHDMELIRLGETIKSLREDRERLVSTIEDMQGELQSDQKDYLSIQAELDEKKIEVSVLKKRASKQIDELNFKLDLASNKKEILEEQNKVYENEFEKLRKSKKLDVNKVRSRERDLEEKLELLRSDAEVQVKNRDYKILDLKRRIDTLEFDIESAHMKEKKTVSSQQVLENKMNNVIKTLRSAIGHLEDEESFEERKRLIKKNLEV